MQSKTDGPAIRHGRHGWFGLRKNLGGTARAPYFSGKRLQAAVSRGNVGLVRLIGVNGMRDKNADAEKSHQYCGQLNHGTHPYAEPALVTWQVDTP